MAAGFVKVASIIELRLNLILLFPMTDNAFCIFQEYIQHSIPQAIIQTLQSSNQSHHCDRSLQNTQRPWSISKPRELSFGLCFRLSVLGPYPYHFQFLTIV